MLTPVEIQTKSFKSGGLGYDKKDVDNYMREILSSYEDLYRENMELKDKIGVLNEGIQYYKTIEKTLQKALVLAEKTAEDTKNNALKEAKHIEKEAAAKAAIMLADAKNELDGLHDKTVNILQQYEKYKAQFKSLAASQIELLESDAFCINIRNLDAFNQNDMNDNFRRADVNEVVSDEPVSGKHLSLQDDKVDEFDFSDFHIDGQEEFDFVDLKDSGD